MEKNNNNQTGDKRTKKNIKQKLIRLNFKQQK